MEEEISVIEINTLEELMSLMEHNDRTNTLSICEWSKYEYNGNIISYTIELNSVIE
jgi:hypothetical protein